MVWVISVKVNDIYVWQDVFGLYWVKFDFDRDEKGQGQESMLVCFVKFYGGDVYGFYFLLIQGMEVVIVFYEGDFDWLYIVYVLYDLWYVDFVMEKNSICNVICILINNKL